MVQHCRSSLGVNRLKLRKSELREFNRPQLISIHINKFDALSGTLIGHLSLKNPVPRARTTFSLCT